MMIDSRKEKTKKNRDSNVFSGAYPNLILTGLSGCGKTVIAQHLAHLFGWGLLDLDGHIEKVLGKSPSEIIEKEGLDSFRSFESQALSSILFLKNHVISLGGGTFCDKKNLSKLRRMGFVVWLDVSPWVIARRLAIRPEELKKRPLLRELPEVKGKNKKLDQKFSKERVSLLLPSSRQGLPSLLEAIEAQRESRASFYRQAHLIVRDNYSSSDIYARKVYHSILGF